MLDQEREGTKEVLCSGEEFTGKWHISSCENSTATNVRHGNGRLCDLIFMKGELKGHTTAKLNKL